MAEQEEPPRQTVLIAEDEELLAKAIAATLDLEGLQTVVAADGEQALELACRIRPDLVLLDVTMPGRSGIEVCATLKTNPETAAIPVIMITARTQKEDQAVGFAAGAAAYVTKPFSPVALIDLVKEALDKTSPEPQYRRPGLSTMPIDQLVVYARDVRELFERERLQRQALEEAHRRLAELDRLKAAFLGAVTHELMTPFAAIGLVLEVLQRESEDCQPELRSALDDLATHIAGLHRQISGVIKFADLTSKQREPQLGIVALNQVIPPAVQPIAVLAQGRGVDFRVFVPSDLPRVRVDPELLAEAVFQIAHNAVKFTLSGGRATVKAFEREEWIVIEVEDTGVGLTEEQRALLGQPFEQGAAGLQRGQEFLGLGWTFVRYVAQIHAGWTRAESPGPGRGSVFRLGLPAAGKG
jgi:signal transduction histidine kinase